MTNQERSSSDDRLRRLLKQGDPAGDGMGIAPQDLARMRRAVLTAAEAKARGRSVGFPLVPAAAVVALVALVAWIVRVEVASRRPEAVSRGTIERAQERRVPVETRHAAPQAPTVASGGVRRAASPTTLARTARTIHFVAKTGTQIIWTLDPNLDLRGIGERPNGEDHARSDRS